MPAIAAVSATELHPELSIEEELGVALRGATVAKDWDAVKLIVGELQARRLASAGVVSIASKRGAK